MSTRDYHPLHKHKVARPFYTAWLIDIGGLAFSAACVAAILVTLIAYDGKPPPSWEHLTLNSLVSWISGASHAGLILAISESIGQLKWRWFWGENSSHPMRDFQDLDSASRGLIGSISILLRPSMWSVGMQSSKASLPVLTKSCRSFHSFGAVLMILALAFEPTLQNLPSYPSKLANVSNLVETASVARGSYLATAGNCALSADGSCKPSYTMFQTAPC